MFASATTMTKPRLQAGAYRQVHVTTGVNDASPHALVGMLFDGLFDALAQARGAMQAGNIEAKGRAIGNAVSIVTEGLRAALNLKDGGELAANLDALYGYVAVRLVQANLRNDEAALDECGRLVEPIRQAWSAIGRPGHAA